MSEMVKRIKVGRYIVVADEKHIVLFQEDGKEIIRIFFDEELIVDEWETAIYFFSKDDRLRAIVHKD